MSPDLPNEGTDEHSQTVNVIHSSQRVVELSLLPFAIQLQNIFPVKIIAERYPMDKVTDIASIVSTVNTQINLTNFEMNADILQAQISLEVQINFLQEPRLFDIYFKLLGVFNYAQDYQPELVQHFLQQGSLSVMLPSARELLLSLCTRLQVPLVVLPLIQLSPAPPFPTAENSFE
jgi:hypothetical protein